LYIRGGGASTGAALGKLELQFELSSPSRYAITRSLTLEQLVQAQAAADGGGAAQLLNNIAAGVWVALKMDLGAFAADPAGGQDAGAAPGFKADRLTIGSCLQRLDGCGADQPPLDFCLDKMVLVSA
jgi:hypothetical protein